MKILFTTCVFMALSGCYVKDSPNLKKLKTARVEFVSGPVTEWWNATNVEVGIDGVWFNDADTGRFIHIKENTIIKYPMDSE